MTIRIYGPHEDGYAVEVDGIMLLECLSEDELKALTVGKIIALYMDVIENRV